MSKVFRAIDSLKFDPVNARKHDERNIKAIMDSLRMHGQRKPVVIYSDMIVAGNGTVAAAKRLGWTEVWVNNDPFESLEAAKAYALQDNRSAELAAWDDVVLGDTLEELKEAGWDLDTIGFKDGDLDTIKSINEEREKLEDAATEDGENETSKDLYTKKIEAPIYKPTGEKPPVAELYDRTKFKELVDEIKSNTKLTEDVRDFLEYAATRHVIFNYQNIAEFYAHADKETQELMEKSALVIIDFDKAIEAGFVQMTKDLAEAYDYEG